ncbi:YfgM family protein [Desulfogranum japonicum]|uniref:hypothetical protein n=1 Tax=Desulfogranum japonicum TaxID=231447 RepID=UPI00048B48F0|nr:hypothetical protein [Desulfogranum japonicum]
MSEPTKSYKDAELLHNVDKADGLLEQLGLPPKTIHFIRAHKTMFWGVSIAVILVVVTVSLYDSYRAHRLNKSASALDVAIQATDGSEELLRAVIKDYGSLPAGTWAKVELIRRYNEKGEFDKELELLSGMNEQFDDDSVFKPLIISKIAAVYEMTDQNEKALGMYTLLSEIKGFEPEAHLAMARINESMGNKDKAIGQYAEYLQLSQLSGMNGQQDPTRMVVESKLRQLRQS